MKNILPGATIGVLGSGQLGRMFAISARRMGYRVHTFSPDTDTPTGQIADCEIVASYDDLDAVSQFARGVDVVTFEFENVSSEAVEAAEKYAPVHPRGEVLFTAQNRLREKNFLEKNGFPVAPFRQVNSLSELESALQELGTPSVLKTAGFGYDGKGQTKIEDAKDAASAWNALDSEGVLEGWIPFEREVSVVAARGQGGDFAHFGVVENKHENHILNVTVSPADVPENVSREAIEITRGVLEALDVVGVLCVEFFLLGNGKLIINELAPRPHNSGHFTFDANVTSQFEQQLRAVCGLPLGSTEQMRPAAMANLLGGLWPEGGEPNWAAASAFPNVKLHLYGKTEARPGRKMGHLTALAGSPAEAERDVLAARETLKHSF